MFYFCLPIKVSRGRVRSRVNVRGRGSDRGRVRIRLGVKEGLGIRFKTTHEKIPKVTFKKVNNDIKSILKLLIFNNNKMRKILEFFRQMKRSERHKNYLGYAK